jgi:two-component system LytT family response regulator
LKLRTLIVDDERPARQRIRHFLELDSEIEVIGECEDGRDALESIRRKKPDLVFLDIQMPVMDGFAVLKRSSPERPPALIFVTAYDEYAVKAFEANAADYLLKPYTRKRFDEALAKVKRQIRLANNAKPIDQAIELLEKIQTKQRYLQRLAVKSNRGIIFVNCEEIDWIESEDNYILVHAGKQTHVIRESMNAIEQALDPSRFLRIHRRILVNADRIREMRPRAQTSLLLQDGSILPVSRRLKEKVKRFLLKRSS